MYINSYQKSGGIMKKSILSLITLLTLFLPLVSAAPSLASVVLSDNLGNAPDGTFSVTNDIWQAQGFHTTAQAYQVTDVTMPLRIESAGVTGHFSVSIYDATGTGGMPGQSTGTVVAYYDATPLTRSVAPISWHNLSIVLNPDTDYYLVAKGIDLSGATVSSVGWGETADATGLGFPSNRFYSTGSNWVAADEYTVQYPFNMKIEGTAAVPEPSTYALLCISLGVVGYARKRMKKGKN